MRYSPKGHTVGDASSTPSGTRDVTWECETWWVLYCQLCLVWGMCLESVRVWCASGVVVLLCPRWAQINWLLGGAGTGHSCRGWWGGGLSPTPGFLGLGGIGVELLWGFCVPSESVVKVWYLFLSPVWQDYFYFLFFFLDAGLACPCGWVSTRLLCALGTVRASCLGMVCRCWCENEQCLCFKKKKSSKGFKY